MIITLENDFSQNYIEKISIPQKWHEMTDSIMERCTRFSAESEQANALNNFIWSLDDLGVLEHVQYFWAPWISSSVQEAATNQVDGVVSTYGSNIAIQDGKLYYTSTPNYASFKPSVPIKTKNFFMMIRDSKQIMRPNLWGTNIALIGENKPSGVVIAKTTNTSTSAGYVSAASAYNSPNLLIEIGSLSNLEQDAGTKINLSPVLVGSGYDKSAEPFGSTLTDIANSYNEQTPTYRWIFIAGDGTALTQVQREGVYNAMETFGAALLALES